MYLKENIWYKFREKEQVVLNTNHVFGKHRFACRFTGRFDDSVGDASKFIRAVDNSLWRSFVCGAEQSLRLFKDSNYYSITIYDDDIALMFELAFVTKYYHDEY